MQALFQLSYGPKNQKKDEEKGLFPARVNRKSRFFPQRAALMRSQAAE
jgi:hypothetical protein